MRTMPETAINFHPASYNRTTMRDSYIPPKKHDNPVWRNRDPLVKFDVGSKLKVANRSDARASGYGANR